MEWGDRWVYPTWRSSARGPGNSYARFDTRLISQIIIAITARTHSRCSATEVSASTTRATTQITTSRIAIHRNECFTTSDRSRAGVRAYRQRRDVANEKLLTGLSDQSDGGRWLWFSHSNNPAREATACIANRLRFQIVFLLVHDDRETDNRIIAAEREHLVRPIEVRLTRSIGF